MLISFLVMAVVVGLIVWLITTYLPMPQPIKVVVVISALALLLYGLKVLGLGNL